MSAQVTEAHLRLANQLVSSPPSPLVLATLIADSEAKATAQLRADRDYNHECINRLASATGTLGEKSGRVVEVALSTIARAERADAELAAERDIVSRIWVQLGSPTYEQLKGRSIYDLIDEMRAELATERARLDWLESDAGMEFQWETTKVITRAAIDAAIKEEMK